MCILHKWSRWVQYDECVPARRISKNFYISGMTRHMQSKACNKCGKVKIEMYDQTIN